MSNQDLMLIVSRMAESMRMLMYKLEKFNYSTHEIIISQNNEMISQNNEMISLLRDIKKELSKK